MAESNAAGEQRPGKNRDEIALELMKFIALETGYGKSQGGAGFSGKSTRSAEEQADSLIQLFQRCREVVGRE